MYKINSNNPVFSLPEYQKDKSQFHMIELNRFAKDVLIYSDEETYIICRREGKPTWIWSVDNIDEDKVDELQSILINCFLTDNQEYKFTCKKELYEKLKECEFPGIVGEPFEMGSLKCEEIIEPKQCDGFSRIATMNDLDIIAQYRYDSAVELTPNTVSSLNIFKENTEKFIEKETFFVWENDEGKIVSIGAFNVVKSQARITHVYTPPQYRCKGYAANLVYDITDILLNAHLQPLLYTDYNYPASNKAYKNIGYVDTGVLINFTCKKPQY